MASSFTTLNDAASTTDTVSLHELATYNCVPLAESVTLLGCWPTRTRRATVPAFASISTTSPVPSHTAYRRLPSADTAISIGEG